MALTIASHDIDGDGFAAELERARRNVTICIAASGGLNTNDVGIVLCTDTLVTGEVGSAESMFKQRVLPHGFNILTAGDTDEILALLPIIKRALFRETVVDDSNIQSILVSAIIERKNQKITELLGTKFGITYNEFKTSGPSLMSADYYRNTVARITEMELRAQFIVAGFSMDVSPLIAKTTLRGEVKILENFAAAGSGEHVATAALLARRHTEVYPLNRGLYCTFEAKKYAEGVATVGKLTILTILRPDKTVRMVSARGLAALERQFQKCGPQPLDAEFTLDASAFENSLEISNSN